MENATVFFLAMLLVGGCHASYLNPRPLFPSIVVFGDSTVDTGNNNHIHTPVKANHEPYGLDFPRQVPTGRFCNGKLVPDLIATELGIKETVPPFLAPNLTDDDLVTGVSFASSGSGFDDQTTLLTNVIPVSKQTDMFRSYIARITKAVGEEKAKRIINGAAVMVSAGTNDFIFNVYDFHLRRKDFNVSGYQNFLQRKTMAFLQELYELGCRKFFVSGLPPIGCLPIQLTLKFHFPSNKACIGEQNSDAETYNRNLQKMLSQTQATLWGSKMTYIEIYQPLFDMFTRPQSYGFEETRRGCCGTGLIETIFLCNSQSSLCSNRSQYMFWDSIHPSAQTYKFVVNDIVKSFQP